MSVLKCENCGAKVKTEEGKFTATCEYCGSEMTIFESTAEFEIDSKGVLVQYNGKGGDVVLPDNILKIGKEAFKDCTGISTISFSSNLRVIGEAAFSGCTSLTSVGLESGLEKISSCAFLNCKELTVVGFSIPNTVNSVGAYAFNECNKLILQKNRLSYVSGWVVGFNSVVGTGGANDGLTIYNPDLEGNDYASLKLTIESGTRGIAASALSGVRSIKSVTFPSSVKYTKNENSSSDIEGHLHYRRDPLTGI